MSLGFPDNAFQQVQTYQKAGLARLQNLCCVVSTANTKFKNFQSEVAQLGQTVNIQLPTRVTTVDSLIASWGPLQQRLQPLTVNKKASSSYAVTNEEFLYNADGYMDEFGKSATTALGAKIEIDVSKNLFENYAYRFYGNGITPINSYTQVATSLAMFRDFGSDLDMDLKFYIPNMAEPAIIGTGQNQFSPRRNDEDAKSWEIGSFSNCDFYRSNLLPKHVSGTLGNEGTTLTLVSTNDPTGASVTQLTCSGAGTDSQALFANDLGQFQDGVSGQEDARFLTFTGYHPCENPVQFRVTAAAASSGGNITFNIAPALSWVTGPNQNISRALTAGMQIKFVPTHRRGQIVSSNAMYIAMPRMPNQAPFPTSNLVDPETGVSMRLSYGAKFGEDQLGWVHDQIWGSTGVPEYMMNLIFTV